MIGDHLHWYLTDRCNLRCPYCFKPDFGYDIDDEMNLKLAGMVADSDIKKVTLGGGEPLLAKNIREIARILRKGGKYVSLHTNGVLLSEKLIQEIDADDIAIPIDTMDRKVQLQLRGERFSSTFDDLHNIAKRILESEKGLGYHTVFTALTLEDIPGMYKVLTDFDYWRIYEMNYELAWQNVVDHKDIGRYNMIDVLKGPCTLKKGHTDSLFARFLLQDEHDDPRVQYVSKLDAKEPYAFLENSGDITYYTRSSFRKRDVAGNIFHDGYDSIRDFLQIVDEDYKHDEESFLESTIGDLPLWARLWDGSFREEEILQVDKEYIDTMLRLSRLFQKRFLDQDDH